MRDTELSLVSISDILDELDRRLDHWVFSGEQLRNTASSFKVRRWNGNTTACSGMAANLQTAIYDQDVETDDDLLE